MPPTTTAPNHHRDFPGFAGFGGLIAGLSFLVGRGPTSKLVADLASVGHTDHVVDVGCGPGSAAREAARRGATVTGVDPAAVMLTLARWISVGRRVITWKAITWKEGAAESLPVADGAATLVWSIATVHHWRDIDAGLAEAHRVLTAGGRLFAIERRTRAGATGLASHGWTDDQAATFAAAVERAGFRDASVTTHPLKDKTMLVVQAAKPGS